MTVIWGILSILSFVSLIWSVLAGTGFFAPLLGCVVFGALFHSSLDKANDRKKQIEINDRLARIEELRDPKPAEISTVPVGHVRKHIAGHQVDVPIDPPPGPTRLKNPHQQG